MAIVAHRGDLAARLKGRLRLIRARVEGRDALIDAVRQANATRDPHAVAAWLVEQATQWVPVQCWAVLAPDVGGHLVVLAQAGSRSDSGPSLSAASSWVMRHGVELFSADLARDDRVARGASGAAIALPLVSRQRTIGALVGLDRGSSAVPALGPSLTASLRILLEPAAIALDNSLALEKAEALSVTDDLTRLYNSRYLNQVLRRETKRAARSGWALSLLFVDLDDFKSVNDTYGHLAGGQALTEAAVVIRESARETDVTARFGGDEFTVVLPETDREGALFVAERMRDRLREFTFLASMGLSVHLSASIGVATLPDVAGSAEELLRAADMAMYKVKGSGKDGIYVAQDPLS
jgi:diguanylate cyclase (GGDEF)-like protein